MVTKAGVGFLLVEGKKRKRKIKGREEASRAVSLRSENECEEEGQSTFRGSKVKPLSSQAKKGEGKKGKVKGRRCDTEKGGGKKLVSWTFRGLHAGRKGVAGEGGGGYFREGARSQI